MVVAPAADLIVVEQGAGIGVAQEDGGGGAPD